METGTSMASLAQSLAISSLFEFLLMGIVWCLAVRNNNAAFVDVAWSASFCAIALIYDLVADGAPVRKIVITSMVACWSLRLAIHLWNRIKREKTEDARYAEMRRAWGAKANRNFFAFFQLQALTVIILSTPFLASAGDPYDMFRPAELVGLILFCLALTGEVIADRQLAHFKSDQTNRTNVCDVGLWHYSRHPNYFFEWLIWCAFFIYAMQSPFGIWTVVAPLLMLLFLTKMSGIPLAEKQSIKSKGEKYIKYQQTTSPFVPWFRRSVDALDL